jgi:hypothetical protein
MMRELITTGFQMTIRYDKPIPIRSNRGRKVKVIFEDLDKKGASKFFPCTEGRTRSEMQRYLVRLGSGRKYLGFSIKTQQDCEDGVMGVTVWRGDDV